MSTTDEILIYTDGSSLGNPGPGGWAAVLIHSDKEKELSGGFRFTTNNRMEIYAVIQGLSAINKKTKKKIQIFTDSRLIYDAFKKRWVYGWRQNNWVKADGVKALNSDLWDDLLRLVDTLDVNFNWVKAHNNDKYNELCDQLGKMEAAKPDLPKDTEYERINPSKINRLLKSNPPLKKITQGNNNNNGDRLVKLTKHPIESHYANNTLKFKVEKNTENEEPMVKIFQTDPNNYIIIPFDSAEFQLSSLIKDIKKLKDR